MEENWLKMKTPPSYYLYAVIQNPLKKSSMGLKLYIFFVSDNVYIGAFALKGF